MTALRVVGILGLVGCGSAVAPTTTSRDRPCEASCVEIDVKPPVRAVAIGSDGIAVAVRGGRGVLFGIGRIEDGAWDPATLRLVPVEGSGPGPFGVGPGLHEDGEAGTARMFHSDATGLVVTQIDDDAEREELGRIAGTYTHAVFADPARLVAARADGALVRIAWAPAPEPTATEPLPFEPAAAHALAAGGGFVARASARGVELLDDSGAIRAISDRSADSVVLAVDEDRGFLGFRDARGVFLVDLTGSHAPLLIDDGDRVEEPGHRVGADLAIAATHPPIVAYQDQTDGTLLTGRFERVVTRQAHGGPYARGFGTCLVTGPGGTLAFDVGLSASGGALRGTLLVTEL